MEKDKKSSQKPWVILSRCIHRWTVPLVALPILLTIVTGIALQMKTTIPGIQPKQMRGTGRVPTLPFSEILSILKKDPELRVYSWEDVRAIDVRPAFGVIRVRCKSDYEVQLDAQTGKVLNQGIRHTHFLIALHEGTWFGEKVKYGIFLPAALLLLGLWITGIILFIVPYIKKVRGGKAHYSPMVEMSFSKEMVCKNH
jgi:hypothetical protein